MGAKPSFIEHTTIPMTLTGKEIKTGSQIYCLPLQKVVENLPCP